MDPTKALHVICGSILWARGGVAEVGRALRAGAATGGALSSVFAGGGGTESSAGGGLAVEEDLVSAIVRDGSHE